MEKEIQQTIIFKADEEEKDAIRKTLKILDEICDNSSCTNCPFKIGKDCYKNCIDEDLRSVIRGDFSVVKKID